MSVQHDILVFSVPHTGTHFIKYMLEKNGFMPWVRHVNAWSGEDCICPIRDPYETYCTWVTRDRKQDFYEQWETLNRICTQGKGFVLPIDTEDRGKRLIDLSLKLNREIKTDWNPENVTDRTKIRPVVDLSDIYNLQVVRDYYRSQENGLQTQG